MSRCIRCDELFQGQPWEFDRATGERAHVDCNNIKPKNATPAPWMDERGTVQAKMAGTCVECCEPIEIGDPIRRLHTLEQSRWVHRECEMNSRRSRRSRRSSVRT